MTRRVRSVYQMLVTCIAALFTMAGVHAALVDLDAFVSLAILDNLGVPLVNGSTVLIIGSTDNVNDGMVPGGGGTNLIYNQLNGDDVLLGKIAIGDNGVTSNGTFDVTVQFDSDDINYVYIRFFDQIGSPHVTGFVWWGTSTVIEIPDPEFGVSEVQFDPNGSLQVNNQDNFVIIPEPATANLMVLFLGMMWVMRKRMKKNQR